MSIPSSSSLQDIDPVCEIGLTTVIFLSRSVIAFTVSLTALEIFLGVALPLTGFAKKGLTSVCFGGVCCCCFLRFCFKMDFRDLDLRDLATGTLEAVADDATLSADVLRDIL